MNIENINDDFIICMPCKDDNIESITNNMSNCSIQDEPLTIYISSLLEKLLEDMVYVKKYDVEAGQYILEINPPLWFNMIDVKYQNMLIKLIEPVLREYVNKKDE